MSQTMIFTIGVIIYAITIVGVVMAGGIWLRGLANEEASPAIRRAHDRQIDEHTPDTD
ncbi:MAG: hypothetical protein OEZ14_09840 [Acidimicrobiia bacterium]|nr:hypothetical protein [Acidimicrobiia bacterium]MDH5520818.1 hypothetical protein [Acidimicrobiia bacterium]